MRKHSGLLCCSSFLLACLLLLSIQSAVAQQPPAAPNSEGIPAKQFPAGKLHPGASSAEADQDADEPGGERKKEADHDRPEQLHKRANGFTVSELRQKATYRPEYACERCSTLSACCKRKENTRGGQRQGRRPRSQRFRGG
jgi:hypothetical protein